MWPDWLGAWDLHTVFIYKEICLLASVQDIGRLRRLACERGLVNASLRRRCWPLLLGLGDQHLLDGTTGYDGPSTSGQFEETLYQFWHGINHRDGHVVVVDVERSVYSVLILNSILNSV